MNVLSPIKKLLSGSFTQKYKSKSAYPDLDHLLHRVENEDNEALERELVDTLLKSKPVRESSKASSPTESGRPSRQHHFTSSEIPSIHVSELNPELLRNAIEGSGYLIVREFLNRKQSGIIRESIDNALNSRFEAYEIGCLEDADGPWYYPSPYFPEKHEAFSNLGKSKKYQRSGSFRVIDSPRGTSRVLSVYKQLNLPGLLESYFGEPAVIAVRKWVFRLVNPIKDGPTGVGGGWHQDGQFMGEGIQALNLWVALSECGQGTDAPGISLLPKRLNEILEYGTGGAKLNWVVGREVVEAQAKEAPIVSPHFQAGDALFFDHYSLHRSGKYAGQTKQRYALESWFYAGSAHADNAVIPCG